MALKVGMIVMSTTGKLTRVKRQKVWAPCCNGWIASNKRVKSVSSLGATVHM